MHVNAVSKDFASFFVIRGTVTEHTDMQNKYAEFGIK
jgi:hypothetical protein